MSYVFYAKKKPIWLLYNRRYLVYAQVRRRKTKARKATQDRSGTLTAELLDMLLSASDDDSDASSAGSDSSGDDWK